MASWESAGQSDEWYTPKYIFDALECRFDVDVAAPKDLTHVSVPADNFITSNSLDLEWNGFVWMNPPFGGRNGIHPWMEKIGIQGNGIGLAPDRTSAPWWQKAASKCNAVLFISGKVKFIRSDGTKGESPSTGTTLFAYGAYAVDRFLVADKNGLGKSFKV